MNITNAAKLYDINPSCGVFQQSFDKNKHMVLCNSFNNWNDLNIGNFSQKIGESYFQIFDMIKIIPRKELVLKNLSHIQNLIYQFIPNLDTFKYESCLIFKNLKGFDLSIDLYYYFSLKKIILQIQRSRFEFYLNQNNLKDKCDKYIESLIESTIFNQFYFK